MDELLEEFRSLEDTYSDEITFMWILLRHLKVDGGFKTMMNGNKTEFIASNSIVGMKNRDQVAERATKTLRQLGGIYANITIEIQVHNKYDRHGTFIVLTP